MYRFTSGRPLLTAVQAPTTYNVFQPQHKLVSGRTAIFANYIDSLHRLGHPGQLRCGNSFVSYVWEYQRLIAIVYLFAYATTRSLEWDDQVSAR